MKRLALTLFVAVIVPACFLSVFRPDPVSAQPAPAVAGERWEYATLNYTRVGRESFYSFVTTKEKFSESTLIALFKKLGGQADDAANVHNVKVLDLLGSQGWEFVAINQPKELDSTIYFLKRHAR
jgi:hypothetical protein